MNFVVRNLTLVLPLKKKRFAFQVGHASYQTFDSPFAYRVCYVAGKVTQNCRVLYLSATATPRQLCNTLQVQVP